MNGPEHYREAERLFAGRTFPADTELHIEERHVPPTNEDIAAAQVHATLALTAAMAMPGAYCGDEGVRRDQRAWFETIRPTAVKIVEDEDGE